MSVADLAIRAEAAILRGEDFEPLTPEECRRFATSRAFRWVIPQARPDFATDAPGDPRAPRPEREAAIVVLRGDVIALDLRPFKRWRTAEQMATEWGTTSRVVVGLVVKLGLRDTTAHARGHGSAREYSPEAQGLIRREWRAGGRPA